MTCSEKLELLISRLKPMQCECECFVPNQQELKTLLDECGGDVDKASYYACLRLAECSAVVTAEIKTESARDYWLTMARLYRPNKTRSLIRSDGEGS